MLDAFMSLFIYSHYQNGLLLTSDVGSTKKDATLSPKATPEPHTAVRRRLREGESLWKHQTAGFGELVCLLCDVYLGDTHPSGDVMPPPLLTPSLESDRRCLYCFSQTTRLTMLFAIS